MAGQDPLIDLRGMGGWLGAQQSLQDVITQRAADVALRRKQEQENFTNFIKVREALLNERKQQAAEDQFAAGEPGRVAGVEETRARTGQILNAPHEAELTREGQLTLEERKAKAAADAAAVARQFTAEQNELNRGAANARADKANATRLQAAKMGGGGAGAVKVGPGGVLYTVKNGVATPISDQEGNPFATETAEQRNRGASMKRSGAIINEIAALSERINTNSGIYAKASGAAERAAAKLNLDDDVSVYDGLISAFTPLVARALGHVGVLTQQDVDSVKVMFPAVGDSATKRARKLDVLGRLMESMGTEGAEEVTKHPTGPNVAVPDEVRSLLKGQRPGRRVGGDDGDVWEVQADGSIRQVTPPQKVIR